MIDTADQPGRAANRSRSASSRRDRDHPRRQPRLRRQRGLRQRLGDQHPDQQGASRRTDHGRRTGLLIAITPDGSRAYVANVDEKRLGDQHRHQQASRGTPIPVGADPFAIAITPDGKPRLRCNEDSEDVSVINTRTNQVAGPTNPGRRRPSEHRDHPRPAPLASFTPSLAPAPGCRSASTPRPPRTPTARSPTYAWDFGDGLDRQPGAPRASHIYQARHLHGTLTADRQRGLLDLADLHRPDRLLQRHGRRPRDPGVKVAFPGSGSAAQGAPSQGLLVQAAGDRQEAKGRRAKAESAVARAGKAGRSAIVSLKARKAFRKSSRSPRPFSSKRLRGSAAQRASVIAG